MAPPYMDVRTAPLNPCSIETIPFPIRLANGRSVWPMMMSCYELSNNNNNSNTTTTPESSSETTTHPATNSISTNATITSSLTSTETSSLTYPSLQSSLPTSERTPQSPQNRIGHMDISLISVPDNIARTTSPMPLQFDPNPISLPQPTGGGSGGGGILDGQWSCLPAYIRHGSGSTSTKQPQIFCFASAHSTGKIQLHSFEVMIDTDEYEMGATVGSDNRQLTNVQWLCQSLPATNNSSSTTVNPNPLCLSLRWDTSAPYMSTSDPTISTTTPTKIVSTYSNGTMAIHDVVTVTSNNSIADNHNTSSNNNNNNNNNNNSTALKSVQLIERDRWTAHTMFPTNTPAEVWTAAFVGDGEKTVIWSGGDDMTMKIWDTRSTIRPMVTLHNNRLFDAGITCISPHPTQENIVAVGSYDESVILIDTRYITVKQPFWKSGKLGGGIWRMKWHPYTSNRMLVGAMHGGSCVLNFYGTCLDGNNNNRNDMESNNNNNDSDTYNEHWTMKATKYFTEHESMVYGADWLVCPHPTQNGYFEAAASFEEITAHSFSNAEVVHFMIEKYFFGILFISLGFGSQVYKVWIYRLSIRGLSFSSTKGVIEASKGFTGLIRTFSMNVLSGIVRSGLMPVAGSSSPASFSGSSISNTARSSMKSVMFDAENNSCNPSSDTSILLAPGGAFKIASVSNSSSKTPTIRLAGSTLSVASCSSS